MQEKLREPRRREKKNLLPWSRKQKRRQKGPEAQPDAHIQRPSRASSKEKPFSGTSSGSQGFPPLFGRLSGGKKPLPPPHGKNPPFAVKRGWGTSPSSGPNRGPKGIQLHGKGRAPTHKRGSFPEQQRTFNWGDTHQPEFERPKPPFFPKAREAPKHS